MDSSVWISLIGVCGTLGGALFGAWLNPYMQEKKEIRRLKRILKEATPLDNFIIFNAYKNAYLPLNGMIIIHNPQLKFESQQSINLLNENIGILQLNIERMGNEKIIYVRNEFWGYRLALSSEFSFLIYQDKEIQEKLLEGNKTFIKEEIYSLYEQLMQSEDIFNNILQHSRSQTYQPQNPMVVLGNINIFMHNIGVFKLNVDLNHLNPALPTAYLNFPKGEFHPEYKG